MTCQQFEIDGEALMAILQDYNEPKLIEEALLSPNKDEWTKTLEIEIDWKLVDLLKGWKTLRTNDFSLLSERQMGQLGGIKLVL